MSKIGLFYSFNTKNTSAAAELIHSAMGKTKVEAVNVEEATEDDFLKFDKLILGVPTWWDGELPNYWDEFLPCIEEKSFKGKIFAFYGAGDQKAYPDNFVDALGKMADFVEQREGKVAGFVKNEGYDFDSSLALRGDIFVGLPLDFENQADLNESRIKKWTTQLKKEFKELL
jgi:flavodoxin I